MFEQGEINLAANQGFAYENDRNLVDKLIRKYNALQFAIVNETSDEVTSFDVDMGRWNRTFKTALDQTYVKGEVHQMQKINSENNKKRI